MKPNEALEERSMNSKLREILKDYAITYAQLLRTPTIEAKNLAEFKCEQAEKAIRQAVGEEMLGLKPNNPYKTTDGQVPESFKAPAHAYDVANGDWEQKIKEYGGLK